VGANHAPNTNPKIAKSQANFRILIESKYINISISDGGIEESVARYLQQLNAYAAAFLNDQDPLRKSDGTSDPVNKHSRIAYWFSNLF
jgi:hypothetical protein